MVYDDKLIKSGLSKEPDEAPPGKKAAAIIVIHGMGQQTKFETLSIFAENLGKNYARENQTPDPEYKINLEQFGEGNYLAYAQTFLKDKEGRETQTDIYESYWAPITEDKVKFYDVILFLFASCFSSIFRYIKEKGKFKRKVFKQNIQTSVGVYTLILLVLTLIIVSAAGALIYFLPNIYHWFWDIPSFWIRLGACAIVFGITYWLRNVIIQYVGDVCAYISPFKSFKFMEIRDAIQKSAYNVLSTVYSKKSGGKFYYDTVIIVAHSLGTLVSYDTLNALIRNDVLYNLKISVPQRTNALITFGSPLDKVVYNFQYQQKKLTLREGILQTLQPMICDYSSRPAKWINIYAFWDIISGKLDYYDDKTNNPKRVRNLKDKESRIPLLAHNQYWEKKLLYKEVLKNI